MRKFLIFLCLTVLLLLPAASASSDAHTLGYVVSATSDRVHLREAPSKQSASLGLYFTGTPLIILETYLKDWYEVVVGTEHGYMSAQMIASVSDAPPTPKWYIGQVNPSSANGWGNLRSAPSLDAEVLATKRRGDRVTVLGETSSHWYYVETDGLYGYMSAKYVSRKSAEWPAADADPLFFTTALPYLTDWYYSSGAGGWRTKLTLLDDGTFWVCHTDSDMGDEAEAYPNGTRYESFCTGTISRPVMVNQWEYRFTADTMQIFGKVGEERIVDGLRLITSLPAGIGQTYSLYLPSVPQELLTESCQWQLRNYEFMYKSGYILYCHDTEATFISFDW